MSKLHYKQPDVELCNFLEYRETSYVAANVFFMRVKSGLLY